ncbi:uncharacterized protein LOC119688578 isoform X2 [Teleopsis dalmanni]|uniref:uncharacterized protein LOC119688578 isoform X2 n=1 Tax=Teleopsis dalmanni TaxID=139649 RepID=UPI0018CFB46B|nr:uncharacterized protein LOC119688578 isoform X2 [Teleopsis dalmanni]
MRILAMARKNIKKSTYTVNSVLKERINVDKYRQEMTAAWINDIPDDALPVEDVEDFDERFKKEYANKEGPSSLRGIIEKYKKLPLDVKLKPVSALPKGSKESVSVENIGISKSQNLPKQKAVDLEKQSVLKNNVQSNIIKKLKEFEKSVLSQAFKNLQDNPYSSTSTLQSQSTQIGFPLKAQPNSPSSPAKTKYDTQILFQRSKIYKYGDTIPDTMPEFKNFVGPQNARTNVKIVKKHQSIAVGSGNMNKLQSVTVGAKKTKNIHGNFTGSRNAQKLQEALFGTNNVHKLQESSIESKNVHKLHDLLPESRRAHKLHGASIELKNVHKLQDASIEPKNVHKSQDLLSRSRRMHKMHGASIDIKNVHKLQDASIEPKSVPKLQDISSGPSTVNKIKKTFIGPKNICGSENIHKSQESVTKPTNLNNLQDTLIASKSMYIKETAFTGGKNVNKTGNTLLEPIHSHKLQNNLLETKNKLHDTLREPRNVKKVSDFVREYQNLNESKLTPLDQKYGKQVLKTEFEAINKNNLQDVVMESKKVKMIPNVVVKSNNKHLPQQSALGSRNVNNLEDVEKASKIMNKRESNHVVPMNVKKVPLHINPNKGEKSTIDLGNVKIVQNTINEDTFKNAEKRTINVKKIEKDKFVSGNVNKMKNIVVVDKKPQVPLIPQTNLNKRDEPKTNPRYVKKVQNTINFALDNAEKPKINVKKVEDRKFVSGDKNHQVSLIPLPSLNKREQPKTDPKNVKKVQNTINEISLKSAEKQTIDVKNVEETKFVFGNANKIKEKVVDNKKREVALIDATNAVKKLQMENAEIVSKLHNIMAESILGSRLVRKSQKGATKDKNVNRLTGGITPSKMTRTLQDVLTTKSQDIPLTRKSNNGVGTKNKLDYMHILEKRNLGVSGFSAPYKKSYHQYDLIGKISSETNEVSKPNRVFNSKTSAICNISPNIKSSKKKPTAMGFKEIYSTKLTAKPSNKKPGTMTNSSKEATKVLLRNKSKVDKNVKSKQLINKTNNTSPVVNFPHVVGQPINKQKPTTLITGAVKKAENPKTKNSLKSRLLQNSSVKNKNDKYLEIQQSLKKITLSSAPKFQATKKKKL